MMDEDELGMSESALVSCMESTFKLGMASDE